MSYGDGDLIRELRDRLRRAERRIALLEARISKAWALRARGARISLILEALREPEEKS